MSDNADILRIIAGQTALSAVDRASLIEAADELEGAHRVLSLTCMNLIEARQQQIAIGDQLMAVRKELANVAQEKWSVSSGWCSVSGYKL